MPEVKTSADERRPLTSNEIAALAYLTDKMEAYAVSIGKAVIAARTRRRGGSNYASVGAAVCRSLRRFGLTTYLPDLHAWRITAAGREELADVGK